MKKHKNAVHTVNYDEVDFNADHIAKQPLSEFLAEQTHQWPRKSDEERTAALSRVHQLATEKVNKKVSHGDINGTAGEAGETKPAADQGAGGAGDIGAGSGSEPGAAVPAGGKQPGKAAK